MSVLLGMWISTYIRSVRLPSGKTPDTFMTTLYSFPLPVYVTQHLPDKTGFREFRLFGTRVVSFK